MNKLLSLLIIGSVASSVYANTPTPPRPSQEAKELLRKRLAEYTPSERLLITFQYIANQCTERQKKIDTFDHLRNKETGEEETAREAQDEAAQAGCKELEDFLEECVSIHALDHGDGKCALAMLRFMESQKNRDLVNSGTKHFEESLAQ